MYLLIETQKNWSQMTVHPRLLKPCTTRTYLSWSSTLAKKFSNFLTFNNFILPKCYRSTSYQGTILVTVFIIYFFKLQDICFVAMLECINDQYLKRSYHIILNSFMGVKGCNELYFC